jgi:hypothetical protein
MQNLGTGVDLQETSSSVVDETWMFALGSTSARSLKAALALVSAESEPVCESELVFVLFVLG